MPNSQPNGFRGVDLPIVKLIPRSERKVQAKYYKRIEASLRAVGLIEPLLVFPQEDHYEILDGRLRYQILLEMGVETIPCILGEKRESFTGNRMVNHLSAAEEMRMLRKSLEELDEKTIADALGLNGIGHRLNEKILRHLDPRAIKAFESGKISRQCAQELTHVNPERQIEILNLMESCKDDSATFAKGLVLNTHPTKRNKLNGKKTPWSQADQKKSDLLKRLREAEQQQDFFSGLYRQYTTNLLKLVIYVRSLVNNAKVRQYLEDRHPPRLALWEDIIRSTEH
jgi:ParB family transcriptional regulator, chromosome partitioning protein